MKQINFDIYVLLGNTELSVLTIKAIGKCITAFPKPFRTTPTVIIATLIAYL